MAPLSSRAIFLYFVISNFHLNILSHSIGVNYGRIANNIPVPSAVVNLLKTKYIDRVKIFDADGDVLDAFANSDIEIVIGIGNENIQAMTDVKQAENWIRKNVVPYIPQTKITGIMVGNEVLGGSDLQMAANLGPAMTSVRTALRNIGLDGLMYVSSAHALGVLGTSFPPSAGEFRQDLVQYLLPILQYHGETDSPFMINAYPFFAYNSDPQHIPLDYALFDAYPGVLDTNTNLKYTGMLFAQIDAVYAAIQRVGHTGIKVVVSETGWPSMGDEDEPGATPENAGLYNGNLMRLAQGTKGTPGNPDFPLDIYIFALFNENLKPGKTSERHFGLLKADGISSYALVNSSFRIIVPSLFSISLIALVFMLLLRLVP
ncbi:hypothetical protein Leryth_009051 [Lithospermum erythrorhizon]|uniref:glucan endo-1,3-beta-D-glucosidase n=1 Tax=Lithospermum erythrorhizon TaxID=34254 RepID=A0AAV3RRD0_LITER|nr:hypothetical protein Leryth_009051 [Lithospermum erythrorhizon]